MQVFSPTGVYLRKWGTSCVGLCPDPQPGQFKEPYGIQLDDAGNVYVSDNRRIQEFRKDGTYLREFGVTGVGPDQLYMLRRVAVGRGPNPRCTARTCGATRSCSTTRAVTLLGRFGGSYPANTGFNQPYDNLSAKGRRAVRRGHEQPAVEVYSQPDADARYGSFGERGYGVEKLKGVNWPRGVTYNPTTGTLWVADTKNYRVAEWAADGSAPTGRVFDTTRPARSRRSSTGRTASRRPAGRDRRRHLRQQDRSLGRHQHHDAALDATPAHVTNPKAVTVWNGVVYVADSVAHRIVRLRATPAPSSTPSGSTPSAASRASR